MRSGILFGGDNVKRWLLALIKVLMIQLRNSSCLFVSQRKRTSKGVRADRLVH